MAADKDRNSSEPAVSAGHPEAAAPKKRMEELLVTDDSAQKSFKKLAAQEIKTHNGSRKSRLWVPMLLVLFLLAGFGAWFLYPMFLEREQPPLHQVSVPVEKRMEMPARPPQPQESEAQIMPEEILVSLPEEEQAEQLPTELSQDPEEIITADLTPAVADAADAVEVAPAASGEAEEPAGEGGAVATVDEPMYRVQVGPVVSEEEIARATALLIDRGFRPQPRPGSGTVDMIRLLEGIYPLAQAQERLEELQVEFPSAFLLPDGDRWALYIGSFSDRDRARRQQRALAERQIEVAQVDSQLTMAGTLLVVAHADERTAEGIAADIRSSGLRATVEIER